MTPQQTINGLLIQMQALGFPAQDLVTVQKTYGLAQQMFAGQFRGGGKPFLCHLVGTASAVADYSLETRLVVAALMHAAYEFGQFPDGRFGGDSHAHRIWLTEQIGRVAEVVVNTYNRTEFSPFVALEMANGRTKLPIPSVLLLRLCNEVDDMSDGGSAFAAKRSSTLIPHGTICATLAIDMGQPGLGKRLIDIAIQSDAIDWAGPLQTPLYSYKVAPTLKGYLRLRRERRAGGSVTMLGD